ncbi:multiple RNA-binding domain-containing protein 1 [[Candida] anglica]|uniref:Multiple RNA-binding domain-containing protein 1 n=1 Tax=[Candida] anglica TaxID=148631 RepID=A0ABP0EI77_9ASCO
MSRLIVKGLPKYYTEQKLREHFSKQGNVTDVKLMKTRNGESRRFAFIGYKSFEDAEKAARYFNKSFIDTSRIDVEVAKTFSDPTVPISFKENRRLQQDRLREQEDRLLAEEEERKTKKQKVKGKSALEEEMENNPKLKEFMEVMKPSHQVKSWANDAAADGSGAPSAKALEEYLAKQENGTLTNEQGRSQDVIQAPDRDSDNEYEDFGKGEEAEEDEEEEVMMSLSEVPETKPMETTEVDENATDLDWLKARRRHMRDSEMTPEEKASTDATSNGASSSAPIDTTNSESNVDSESTSKPRVAPTFTKPDPTANFEEKISETGRLFIRNILYTSTEEEFRNLFQKYGQLEEVHIAIDTRTGKSKGFVYVQFQNSADAVSAYHALDKEIFQGRLLHILPGEKKKDHRLDEFDLKNLPLKKQKELKRKAQANKTQFSWNSLYMNSDAVLASVAAKMGVSKSQLIDVQSSDSAVKQALAEAHVIGDVRKYFESKGVDLTVFDKKERDDKVILVKNFPYGTTIEELGELFSEHGQIKRMLMPPAGTIAIVEFRDAPGARAAFTKLAYKRFKKSIIYLEKGPKDLFTKEPSLEDVVSTEEKTESAVEAKVTAHDVLGGSTETSTAQETNDDVVDGPTVSIFVKNLNFTTTTEQVTELFSPLTGFVVANVKTKADPKKQGAYLSMGFGFVEFRTKEQANTAISTLDGHILDGHKLQLKLSHRQSGTTSTNKKTATGSKSSKIIIKNLPFEATRKDILELFGAFGHLKSVRVPKKFDKSVRGFAFVEFTMLKEAENAMNQLEGVHLLGRRLVMQYAELDAEDAEEQIDKMTKKVKKQVATQQLGAARLAGKGKNTLLEEESEFDTLG